jgi:hypothetical protein
MSVDVDGDQVLVVHVVVSSTGKSLGIGGLKCLELIIYHNHNPTHTRMQS